MSFLIAAVLVFGLIAFLLPFMGKSTKKSDKKRNKAQILRDANKRLAKDPHDSRALEDLADIYYESQLWDKAYEVYNNLSKLNISNIELSKAHLRTGICAIELKKIPEAVNALLAAYKINSGDFDIMYNLAKALFLMGQFEKAVPLLKKSLVAKPESHGVYLMLAQCFYNAKKYRESLPAFKKALDEEPDNKEALFQMADALTQDGHGEKAMKVFMHLRADPVYGARSCLEAGLFHMKQHRTDQAIPDFEIGLKHENAPQEIVIEIQYNLARCYFETNEIPKGMTLLKDIRSKNQNYKDVNALISTYQELSQNSNLRIYLSSSSNDFINLCRKFILTKYKNSKVRVQNAEAKPMFADILCEISTSKWEDVALFRFFRTTGSTGEIYIREFHSYMQDVKAARGFCVSAGTFTEEARKFTDGRPIDLVEKNGLTKVLKLIS